MLSTDCKRLSPRIYLYTGEQAPSALPNGTLALRVFAEDKSVFGDGSHPTTRLCAGAVDVLFHLQPRRTFLDVGTGTGILARIARARGAELVVGTDIDPMALKSALAHAAFDSNSKPLQVSDDLPDHWGPKFDLVVANILEGPLRSLAPRLARALAPEGILLISGFTPGQSHALRTVFGHVGLEHVSESTLDEWSLLMFKSPKPDNT